jgi:hypothetical protein
MITPTTPEPPFAASRWDILGYLLVGYGGYTALMTLLLAALFMPQTAWAVLQVVFKVIFLVGVVWLLGERRKRFSWASVGLLPPRWTSKGWVWVLVSMAALAGFNLLSEWLYLALKRGSLLDLAQLGFQQWSELWLVLLGMVLLIPLAEEVFFRGAVYAWFEHFYGSLLALIGSAVLFAITRATFFDLNSPVFVLQSLALGLVTGFAMQRTRSLWLAVAIHVFTYALELVLRMALSLV